MKALLLLVCIWATVSRAEGVLKCRRCIGAATLDDCTFSVPCPAGEICFMDMIITEQLTVEYNGGCRPRDLLYWKYARDVCTNMNVMKLHGLSMFTLTCVQVCTKGLAVGKRSYVGCSKCCDIVNPHGSECNAKLCGIKSTNTSKCYHCESESGTGGSGVTDPDKCTNLVSCQSHQICGAETFTLAGKDTFEFKCIQRDLCTLITQESIKRYDECLHGGNAELCGQLRRRETSGTKVCTACCGDSQCNSESCHDIIKRMYNLWKAGVLDFNTLKIKGTTPTTSG